MDKKRMNRKQLDTLEYVKRSINEDCPDKLHNLRNWWNEKLTIEQKTQIESFVAMLRNMGNEP